VALSSAADMAPIFRDLDTKLAHKVPRSTLTGLSLISCGKKGLEGTLNADLRGSPDRPGAHPGGFHFCAEFVSPPGASAEMPRRASVFQRTGRVVWFGTGEIRKFSR